VGDTFYDVEMARRAGAISILIRSGIPQQGLKAKPHYTLKNLGELLELLEHGN